MEIVDGGAPRLGEPLPVELANTIFAVRGQPHDGLSSVGHLAEWLQRARPRLTTPLPAEALAAISEETLAVARELRDSLRTLADASVRGTAPPATAVTSLNRVARSVPRWRELHWTDAPAAVACGRGEPVATALAEIAGAAVDLFAAGGDLRACPGPGCVLFFVRDHRRREWCSAGCGNRARAARHYARHR